MDLPSGISGILVYELNMKPVAGSWPGCFEFASNSGTWGTRIVRVSAKDGIFGYENGGSFVPSATPFIYNTWYLAKIAFDLESRTFDYYINGIKINEDPVPSHQTAALNYFSIVGGNSQNYCEIYFDDVTMYVAPDAAAPAFSGGTEIGRAHV